MADTAQPAALVHSGPGDPPPGGPSTSSQTTNSVATTTPANATDRPDSGGAAGGGVAAGAGPPDTGDHPAGTSNGQLPSGNRPSSGNATLMVPQAMSHNARPPSAGGAAASSGASYSARHAEKERQAREVLDSELGIPTMLNRLKESIGSAREFAMYLRKRALLEEDHSLGLRKLCRVTQENMSRPDHRAGTFLFAMSEMMAVHDRLVENGLQFAQALHLMHTEISDMIDVAERQRKGWKTTGMAAEQRVAEIEATMKKAKAKYDTLAEEYNRVRTGDGGAGSGGSGGGKMSRFKVHQRSPAQQEEDLLRKAQAAEQVYFGQAQAAQLEQRQLLATTRPDAVRALRDVISETDSVVALNMSKFAAQNERLICLNGQTLAPVATTESTPPLHRSLQEATGLVNNERDLVSYIALQHSRMGQNQAEPRFEKNPVMAALNISPLTSHAVPSPVQTAAPSGPSGPSDPLSVAMGIQIPPGPLTGPVVGQMLNQISAHIQAAQMGQQQPYQVGSAVPWNSALGVAPAPYGPPTMSGAQQVSRPSSSHQSQQPQQQQTPPPQLPTRSSFFQGKSSGTNGQAQPGGGSSSSPSSQGPPQLAALPFQTESTASSSSHSNQQSERRGSAGRPVSRPGPTVPGKMFRLPLAALYERDNNPVPLVVNQCIQAVELFGLGVEGIYRQSGSVTHIASLKAMFDADPNSPALDFRNPDNFHHDINSVAGLLKQFFRDLPDPLMTESRYQEFIQAAKKEDEIVRRDMLHAIINGLDDPNYATLRAVTLHLWRVADHKAVTRMDAHNLAVVFGPTLMGAGSSTTSAFLADSGYQVQAIETILVNTLQIFDED